MSQTYSTRQREFGGGNLFSSRVTQVTTLPQVRPSPAGAATLAPLAAPVVPLQAPVQIPEAPREVRYQFALSPQGLPAAARIAPRAAGTVTLVGEPSGTWRVASTIAGPARMPDAALVPALWLIHDLPVPHDLHSDDLALLPRGSNGHGNQPGTIFTVDGNQPTYGPNSNTVTVSITPGGYVSNGTGGWQLTGRIDEATNHAFHPLVMLGPAALANIDHTLPSGTVARILTDLFMRPATVHPELNFRRDPSQRLAAVVRDVLAQSAAPEYLHPSAFTRAAVTLEGLVRGTPRLMPTREGCFLGANTRTEG